MDESTSIASVGAGMLLEDIDTNMYNAGQRFLPHGASGSVGIGGHATVGGAGFVWREYGLTIDYIQEVEVVLADGTIVRASTSENPELFFAIRGAGSSFGIVTEFSFNTLPAPPQTVSFTYTWTGNDTMTRANLFSAWQALTYSSSLPLEMQTLLLVSPTYIVMEGAYLGSLDDFNAVDLPSFLPPAQASSVDVYTNWLQLSQFWAQQIASSGSDGPSFFYLKSTIFRPETRIPDSVVAQMFEYLATADTGALDWGIEIQDGSGQANQIPADETAYPHRDASFVFLSSATTDGDLTNTTVEFIQGLHALAESGNPDEYYGEYAGFIDTQEQPDQARYNYWGPNLPKLEQVKAIYDPLDVFHNAQSVLPGGQ